MKASANFSIFQDGTDQWIQLPPDTVIDENVCMMEEYVSVSGKVIGADVVGTIIFIPNQDQSVVND